MKHLPFLFPIFLIVFAAIPAIGQPIVKADAIEILGAMPAPPSALVDAYQRAYAQGAAQADAKPYYQTINERLVRVQLEAQELTIRFYQQYPAGVRPVSQPNTNRVSAQQQNAMESATAELAQKMMSDKAFAQKFAQMDETAQHAYIAQLLADKGIKPVQGAANIHDKPMPGTDIDWMSLCTEFNQPTSAMGRWERQTALEQKYEAQHAAINAWTEAEIKKLPMISFGEYGHDHDPAQVQLIKKQGLDKHRQVADSMMKEAAGMFSEFRQATKTRCAPLNDALKKVQYGQDYDFGLHYTLVLQTQTMMYADLQGILDNEIKWIEAIAQWEKAWQEAN